MRYWTPPKTFEEALLEARTAITTAQKANQLGYDSRDALYVDINNAYKKYVFSHRFPFKISTSHNSWPPKAVYCCRKEENVHERRV